METLLVLAVLVMIASLVWPTLDRTFDNQRLRKSADQVRAAWARARIKAMSTGRIHIFQHIVAGDRYAIHRRTGTEVNVGSAVGQVPAGFADASCENPIPMGGERKLPKGVTFVASQAAVDSRAEMVSADASQFRQPEQGWSVPIFFYPDGTTSTARLALKNSRGRLIELTLRGLTGVIVVGDVQMSEEALP